jgi:hypothetical protein
VFGISWAAEAAVGIPNVAERLIIFAYLQVVWEIQKGEEKEGSSSRKASTDRGRCNPGSSAFSEHAFEKATRKPSLQRRHP